MSDLEKQIGYMPRMLNTLGMVCFGACLVALIVNSFTRSLELWQLNAVFYYAIGYWFGRLRITSGSVGKSRS